MVRVLGALKNWLLILSLPPPALPMVTSLASVLGASELAQEQLPNKPAFNII